MEELKICSNCEAEFDHEYEGLELDGDFYCDDCKSHYCESCCMMRFDQKMIDYNDKVLCKECCDEVDPDNRSWLNDDPDWDDSYDPDND